MKTLNASNVVMMGSNIRYLMNVQPNSTSDDVSRSLNRLIADLTEADFVITLAFINEFLPRTLKRLSEKGKSNFIGQKVYGGLRAECLSLEKVLFSEARTKQFYTLPVSRYNNNYLLEKPEKFLKEGTFSKLSEMARFDFTSACRCLVFGEATASAFHILRATEEVLKHYYFKHVKSKRLKPKDQVWGAMTTALGNKKVRRPNKAILDSLDLVRRHYRNPTQHPQIKYDISEAEDLLGICIDLINKMTPEL